MFGCDWWIFNCIVIPTKWIYFLKVSLPCILTIFTSSPACVRSIAMRVSVCLSVCISVRSHISKTTCPNFTKRFVHVNSVRGSVLLWRQCITLCTSGFVGDVMFGHNRPGKGYASKTYTHSDLLVECRAPGARCYVLYFSCSPDCLCWNVYLLYVEVIRCNQRTADIDKQILCVLV